MNTISNARNPRGQSGQAMVEFSVLMLVFVPCILYGFFLSDAAYHQLEVQEAVVSTMWDFSARNAQPEDGSIASDFNSMSSMVTAVQSANQAEFADHTSAYDPATPTTTNTQAVFNQLAVQVSWTNQTAKYGDPVANGGTPVTCQAATGNPDLAWTALGGVLNPIYQFGTDGANSLAGSVHCWARAIAYNFLVPQTFLQDFATVNLTNDTSHQSSDLGNVDGLQAAATDVLLQDQSQIAFGTWAIDDGETTLGNSGDNDIQFGQSNKDANPFQRRVWLINAGTPLTAVSFGTVQAQVASFASSADSKVEDVLPFVLNSSLGGLATKYDRSDSLNIIPGVSFDPGLDPLMTFLVARYSNNNSDPNSMSGDPSYGNHPANHCGWAPKGMATLYYSLDVLTCLAKGDNEYESTPTAIAFQDGTNDPFNQAFTNRGAYYMGNQTDGYWTP